MTKHLTVRIIEVRTARIPGDGVRQIKNKTPTAATSSGAACLTSKTAAEAAAPCRDHIYE